MAKVSTRVSKTTGQGVSRKAYQMAYELGQRGAGSDFKGVDTRNYAKPKALKGVDTPDIGVTDTAYQPETLSALNQIFSDPAPRSGARDRPARLKVPK